MIVKKITIENFKGIKKPLTIDLKPIILLFGQNSAGKSSIIQAINYARQIFLDLELNPDLSHKKENSIDLGGYKNIVHNKDVNNPIIFTFDLSFSNEQPFFEFTSQNIDLHSAHSSSHISTIDELQKMSNLIKPRVSRYAFNSLIEYYSEMEYIGKKISDITVKMVIQWNDRLKCPYIELYQVSANNELLFQVFRYKENKKFVQLSIYKHNILPDHFIDHVELIKDKNQAIYEYYNENPNENQDEMYIRLYEQGELFSEAERLSKYWNKTFGRQDTPEEIFPHLKHYAKNIKQKMLKKISYWEILNKGIKENNEKYIDKNLLFENEDLYQSRILPNPEELISTHPERSQFFDYHHEYKNNDNSFYRQLISMFVTTPIRIITKFFENSNHIGPLRKLPTRRHDKLNPKSFSRWVSGIAAYDALLDNESPEEIIHSTNKWLASEEYFKTGYKIDIKRFKMLDTNSCLFEILSEGKNLNEKHKEIQKMIQNLSEDNIFRIWDLEHNIPLSIQDVGTGISQILPIIVGALFLKNRLVSIEQPELHIHPAMQAEMADLFIEQIQQEGGRNNRSFLIETHSEHLMLRILRRIRNTNENPNKVVNAVYPEDVAVYYVVKDKNITDAIHIPITEEGEFLLPWPNGFFPERAKELFS